MVCYGTGVEVKCALTKILRHLFATRERCFIISPGALNEKVHRNGRLNMKTAIVQQRARENEVCFHANAL